MLRLNNIKWSVPGENETDSNEILKGVSLEVPDGKLTVITGPNGGGKTSLAKLIAGLETPDSGSIQLDDADITNWDMTKRAKSGICFAFQQPVKFKGLTVRDLIELAAGEKCDWGKICDLLGGVGLCADEYIDRTVDSSLSGGESKRIEIATVLARKDAKVIIFDEPEAGIDLWSFNNLIDVFKKLKDEHGAALLVISHQERILEIADNIVVVADGKVRTSGAKDSVLPELMVNEKSARCPRRKDIRSEAQRLI